MYYYHLLLIHNTKPKVQLLVSAKPSTSNQNFLLLLFTHCSNSDSTKCKNSIFSFGKYSLVSRFFKIFFLNPRLYGFSCFRFQYCNTESKINLVLYVFRNKFGALCVLPLLLCTSTISKTKKERRMKNSRFLENSQNHFNFLYRKVRKNW